MGIFSEIADWGQEIVSILGIPGLFILSFIESSFFPIPTEVFLIPLAISGENPLLLGVIATIGSVLGSILGYYIGKKGGRVLLKKYAGDKLKHVEKYFDKYGIFAIGIAAFTPIPYKVFTIAAGVFDFDIKKMLLVSLLGRGVRFIGIAVLASVYGSSVINLIDSLGLYLILVIGLVVVIYFIKKSYKNFL